jgi:D-3-phosphoglycerate dehydrogenase
MISLAFTGYDQVDLDYARSKEIQVYYVPGYATASVAELNLALTLSILRKIPTADRTIRKCQWHDQVKPGIELAGKTVGIIGTGTIGLKTAQLFRAFECSVIGWSKRTRDEFTEIGGTYKSKETVFSKSDIVVLCLALNEDTRYFVGQTQLELMKNGAILINTARSDLVEKSALLLALADRRIFAGIDVFEDQTEKRGWDELFQFDNVVLTPHLGFKTKEALHHLAEEVIQNIGRFFAGSIENLVK